jgi:hypothetical protein
VNGKGAVRITTTFKRDIGHEWNYFTRGRR